MSNRIPNEQIVAWLKDRLLFVGTNKLESIPNFEFRNPPALLHDISIFGKSLVSHRLNLPRGYKFGTWLFAYEAGLAATLAGRDPIKAIAPAAGINEKKLRLMLSGFKSHPIDDMAHIARVMSIAAHRNFFGQKDDQHEDIVKVDGKPAMGVEGVIISAYGNSIPLRDSINLLYRPAENYGKKLIPAWKEAYKKYAIDEDSLRVLDTLLFTAERGYTIVDRLHNGVHSKNAYYKPKVKKHLVIHPQLLQDVEQIVVESKTPIPDLYELLVPDAMNGVYFTAHIGNKGTQTGLIRQPTKERLLAWVEMQRHEIEKREKGPFL